MQIILFDTPGVIQKEMHTLDSMMMKNVKKAAVDADCMMVVVDACKMPHKVSFICFCLSISLFPFFSPLFLGWGGGNVTG